MKKLTLLLTALFVTPLAHAETELECLAKNIYHEARGETLRGRLAVAQVTLNRKRQLNKTICQVVYQPYQFSWTLKPKAIVDFNSWVTSVVLAHRVLQRGWAIRGFAATHYHNHTVNPQWNLSFKKLTTIGNHTFYS